MLFAGLGCMDTDRVIAIQLDAFPAFSAPTLVTGLRADTLACANPALTADELAIYLSSDTNADSDIWTSTRTSTHSDWKPAVSRRTSPARGTTSIPTFHPMGW